MRLQQVARRKTRRRRRTQPLRARHGARREARPRVRGLVCIARAGSSCAQHAPASAVDSMQHSNCGWATHRICAAPGVISQWAQDVGSDSAGTSPRCAQPWQPHIRGSGNSGSPCTQATRLDNGIDAAYGRATAAADGEVMCDLPEAQIVLLGMYTKALRPGGWLSDEVLNACMERLQQRAVVRWKVIACASTCMQQLMQCTPVLPIDAQPDSFLLRVHVYKACRPHPVFQHIL